MEGRVLDGLSSLPDEILLEILCRTRSYKTSIVSSSLSKRWKNLYFYMREVCFEDLIALRFPTDHTRFSDIIKSAFSRHKTEIRTLNLENLPAKVVQNCLSSSPTKTIENLYVTNYFYNSQKTNVIVSNSLLSLIRNFSNLVSLELYCCTVFKTKTTVPDNFLGFPCLETIVFRNVYFCDVQWMHKIFELSEILKTVKIVRCHFPRPSLRISCPSVTTMVMDGYLVWMGNRLVLDCPKLVNLAVDYEFLDRLQYACGSMDKLTVTSIPKPSISMWKKLSNATISPSRLKLVFKDYKDVQVRKGGRELGCSSGVKAESVVMYYEKFGERESEFASHVLEMCPYLSRLFIWVRSFSSYSVYEKFVSELLSVRKDGVTIRIGSKDLLNETIEI